jgi:epsilon-lactone hydrolase
MEGRKRAAPVPALLRRRCEVVRSDRDGMEVVTLTPKRGATGTQLMYLHGGAYVNALMRPHWTIVSDLVRRTGATVTVPMYPRAPEHTALHVFPRIRSLYDALRAGGRPVFVAGDSAGGGLALSLAIQLRDAGIAGPDALLLFSPWLDLTMTNPEIPALEPIDPMLHAAGLIWCGERWAGDLPTTDPRLSPIYDDLRDLPPTHVYQGGRDIFVADARRFAQKAEQVGAHVDLHHFADGFHVFVAAPFTPESRLALTHAARVIIAGRK